VVQYLARLRYAAELERLCDDVLWMESACVSGTWRTVAARVIEPLGVFFLWGGKTGELLRLLCGFPQQFLTQVAQYLARLRYAAELKRLCHVVRWMECACVSGTSRTVDRGK
jgi:hypothetical protein